VIALAFFAFILWIIYQADAGHSNIFFRFVRSFRYGDKVGHLLLFGFLVMLINMTFRFKTVRIGSLSIYLGSMLVAIFVVLEEFSQKLFPSRTFDYADLLADAVGIVLFSILSYRIAATFSKNVRLAS